MKKRALSLFLAFAMVLSMIPIVATTATATLPSHDVTLHVRGGDNLGGDLHIPFEGDTLTISEEKEYSMEIEFDRGGIDRIINLCIMTKGADWTEFPWGFDNAYADAPTDWNGEEVKAEVEIKRVIVNPDSSSPIILNSGWELPLVAQGERNDTNPAAGFIDIQMWNAYHMPHSTLTGSNLRTGVLAGTNKYFNIVDNAGAAVKVQKIKVVFDVILDPTPPAHIQPPEDGGVSVRLQAREAVDFTTDGSNFWKSEAVKISQNGEYTLTAPITGEYTSIASLAIMANNSTFNQKKGFRGRALLAPLNYKNPVKIFFTSVKVNGKEVGNDFGEANLISTGMEEREGYAYAPLWNGWFGDERALTTGIKQVNTGDAVSFGLTDNSVINSVEVKFIVYGIPGSGCWGGCEGPYPCQSDCFDFCFIHEDVNIIENPCRICAGEICGTHRTVEFTEEQPTCGICDRTHCVSHYVKDCVPCAPKGGDIRGTGTVKIEDAVEILCWLAKLTSVITDNKSHGWKAALITEASITANKPAIGDAVEILCFLAKLNHAPTLNWAKTTA